MHILVTGGAGYIGSHAVRELIDRGHKVYVLDNLSHGHRKAVHSKATFIDGCMGNVALMVSTLRRYEIEAVMHFAANTEVGESVIDPLKYYRNNFVNSLSILQALHETGIKKLVFSSTAAVYGNPEKNPIDENQRRQPISPYGRSKMMTEMAIEDFALAHGLGYTILRYFNVAGASPDGTIGEDHRPESHLIPRILMIARDGVGSVKLFGNDYPTPDGTCIRDYVHVVDLARAHAMAIETMDETTRAVFNLGSENGFSVREVIAACERVTGVSLPVSEEPRRPGDAAVLVASSAQIRKTLGWERLYPSIEEIISHAWHWHCTHPQGFATRQQIAEKKGLDSLFLSS